jgi:hypothetical protein
MPLITRERTDEIKELEELWAHPAVPEPLPPRRRYLDLARGTPRVPGALVAGGWIAFFLAVVAFQPAPDPHATTPLWANLVFAGMAMSLVAAALLGPLSSRFGFAAAVLGGCFGMAISVGCLTTGHHAGSWWIGELGATAALTALAAGGLAGRLRGR